MEAFVSKTIEGRVFKADYGTGTDGPHVTLRAVSYIETGRITLHNLKQVQEIRELLSEAEAIFADLERRRKDALK